MRYLLQQMDEKSFAIEPRPDVLPPVLKQAAKITTKDIEPSLLGSIILLN